MTIDVKVRNIVYSVHLEGTAVKPANTCISKDKRAAGQWAFKLPEPYSAQVLYLHKKNGAIISGTSDIAMVESTAEAAAKALKMTVIPSSIRIVNICGQFEYGGFINLSKLPSTFKLKKNIPR